VPVADLSFRGPYGVYHSIYDNHNWVERVGDPGFRYHVALVQLWGLLLLRLADADVLPLDYEAYAGRVEEFVAETARAWPDPGDLGDARTAAGELRDAAAGLEAERARALLQADEAALGTLDRDLMRTERALLDPDGLPGRPWYRHVVFAPAFTYAPEVVPAVTEAVRAGDRAGVKSAAARLASALRRAAASLRGTR
jgi:N-acetylated-alpha-linked acidic dipeptidase